MSEVIQLKKQKSSEVGLIEELAKVQIATIEKVLTLADKYNCNRDDVFRMFLNVLKRMNCEYSLKYYEVEGEADD